MKRQTQLLTNDFIMSPSIQLMSTVTRTDEDRYYHDHNFYEIFYVIEGQITHVYNDKKERLVMGDIRLLRPNDCHSFIRENNEPCAHRDVIITKDLFKNACNYIDSSILDQITRSSTPLKSNLPISELLRFENDFSSMFFLPSENSTFTRNSMTNILVVELLRVFLNNSQTKLGNVPSWLKEIIPNMSTPIAMREGIEFILHNIGYDRSYICRAFKKFIGCTMTEYLRERRLELAATILLTSDKTVAQVCEEIGFESIPYFTVSFKNKYALSPKQFKLKYSTKNSIKTSVKTLNR